MFALVISEKGGAERREAFQQAEIHIGRVQGNELTLPKGNVSKRHARLVCRDGRFIVTDMNSTNGTYVNRRRISQATLVRQGDRIYIGDYVIRVEAREEPSIPTASASAAPIPLRDAAPSTSEAPARSQLPPPPPPLPSFSSVPSLPPPAAVADSSSRRAPSVVSSLAAAVESAGPDRAASPREESIDPDAIAFRSAVVLLVSRVAARVSSRSLAELTPGELREELAPVVSAELSVLRREDALSAAILDARLETDALRELAELGPIGALLDDETITEISVAAGGVVSAVRGRRRFTAEPQLSSEASVRRILARLARLSGQALSDGDEFPRRRLPGGLELSAVSGPRAPAGTLIHIERQPRVDSTLEDLVRAGVVSRGMATFFRQVAALRGSVLVTGPRAARPLAVAGAIACGSADGQVVAFLDEEALVTSALPLSVVDVSGSPSELGELVRLAARLPDSRIVTDRLTGPLAAALVEATASGAQGICAVQIAPTARRALAALPGLIAAARPGLPVDVAREWVSATFDLVIEVAVLRDGRQRVVRVAEPAAVVDGEIALRDIFVFQVERTAAGGAVEGTFQATGTSPRLVAEMSARGVQLDSGVFSRPASR